MKPTTRAEPLVRLSAREERALRQLGVGMRVVDSAALTRLTRLGLANDGAGGVSLTPAGLRRFRDMPLIQGAPRIDLIQAVLDKYTDRFQQAPRSPKVETRGRPPKLRPVPPSELAAVFAHVPLAPRLNGHANGKDTGIDPSGVLDMTTARQWMALARVRLERTRTSLLLHRDLDKAIHAASRACILASRARLSVVRSSEAALSR